MYAIDSMTERFRGVADRVYSAPQRAPHTQDIKRLRAIEGTLKEIGGGYHDHLSTISTWAFNVLYGWGSCLDRDLTFRQGLRWGIHPNCTMESMNRYHAWADEMYEEHRARWRKAYDAIQRSSKWLWCKERYDETLLRVKSAFPDFPEVQ